MDNARLLFPTLGYAPTALDAVRGADVVLHLTEWREFRELDPSALADVARGRVVLDGRNTLDAALWRKAGWTYRAMGRPNA
jgi:UDPglucose 6-dehydrogenase